jgi:hypothetical protein
MHEDSVDQLFDHACLSRKYLIKMASAGPPSDHKAATTPIDRSVDRESKVGLVEVLLDCWE